MAVFVEEWVLWLGIILLVGGVLGAIFVTDAVRPTVEALIGVSKEPYILSWVAGWLISRATGFVIGVLAAFIVVDVPFTFVIIWLKKHHPELFQPRRG